MEEKLKEGYLFTLNINKEENYVGALQLIEKDELKDFIELTDEELSFMYYLDHIKSKLSYNCCLIVEYTSEDNNFTSYLKERTFESNHYEEKYLTKSKTFKGALLKLNYNPDLNTNKRGRSYVKR